MSKLIIGATYYQQLEQVELLLLSMSQQTNDNWELHILSNGDESVYKIHDEYPHLCSGNVFLHCSKENTGSWGVYNRIQFVKEAAKRNPTAYVTTTSSEDYYVPTFVESVLKHDTDMVYWDFVTHIFEYKTIQATCRPWRSKIDWGCFAVKANKMSFPEKTEEIEAYISDGLTAERLVRQQKLETMHIPSVLFIKN